MSRLAIFVAYSIMLFASSAAAQEYPNHPIRLIVPFAAGGTTDLTGRIMAAQLGAELGQQVVVENIDGAGGTVGAEAAARARPDGYTLILHVASTSAINPFLYPNLAVDMREDFEPVSLMTRAPLILLARKDFPAETIEEFIALARQNPGQYNYGSSGNGTIAHLSGALLERETEIDIVHIPYRGGGPAMNDLIAGVIDILIDNLPTGLVQVNAGNVKALAITSAARSAVIPDLPTLNESGYPNYNTYSWGAIYAPKDTPRAIIDILAEAAIATAQDPETIARLEDLGPEIIGSTADELALFRDEMLAYWGPIVAASGARIE
ncbi:MAG: tripartite tricarboxylate transporter substrate binding protein [Micropepsaceae bacterium]